jgi:hypothetical protein
VQGCRAMLILWNEVEYNALDSFIKYAK